MLFSAKGSTNFWVHPDWAGYDIRLNLEKRFSSVSSVTYLNDGNAGGLLWGHFTLFGGESRETSLSAIIGNWPGRRRDRGRQRGEGP